MLAQHALIIVDMVKDFTDPEGLVYYPQNKLVLPKIADVLAFFHKRNELVIFMQHRYRAGKPDANLENMRVNCIEGSGGEEIDSSLTVLPDDYVIPKRRYSAFFGTDLDLVLREHNVTDVVVVGTKTNCCIRATVTDAHYLNYHPIVLEDCVATNDETVQKVHLDDIRKYFGTVMSSDTYFKERN